MRDQLLSLTAQRRAKQTERDMAEAATRDLIQRVIGAIRSDVNHGQDSPLLAAIGYVTRKTGKTNKANGSSPLTAKAAAK